MAARPSAAALGIFCVVLTVFIFSVSRNNGHQLGMVAPTGRVVKVSNRQPCVTRRGLGLAGVVMGLGISSQLNRKSNAISGGGKGYSGYTIEEQDFSGKDMAGEEFRGTMAKRVNFRGTNLQNAQFQKADLRFVDFTGADLTGAALEQCTLEGAIFKDTVLEGAYLGEPILKAETIEGADFTDAIIASSFTQRELCKMASGTNSKTGVTTKESLGC
mmetsp:Transcript_18781/g.28140  ORF Transcript_18781/g.28140 Transcript_18781/m.28140 type:complete len:216 (+) Transcript_18781:69-716(+)